MRFGQPVDTLGAPENSDPPARPDRRTHTDTTEGGVGATGMSVAGASGLCAGAFSPAVPLMTEQRQIVSILVRQESREDVQQDERSRCAQASFTLVITLLTALARSHHASILVQLCAVGGTRGIVRLAAMRPTQLIHNAAVHTRTVRQAPGARLQAYDRVRWGHRAAAHSGVHCRSAVCHAPRLSAHAAAVRTRQAKQCR